MSLFHPLWPDRPSSENLELGRSLAESGMTTGSPTNRERAYISTIAAYFDDGLNKSEQARLAAFAEAWQAVHNVYPEDKEATAFYSLAQLTQAPQGDKSHRIQREVGPLLERILESSPNHPGAHHYLIHAYDFPPLAEGALEVARNYASIGPQVTHALHMSTHIFTLLGLWDEVAANNIKAGDAALDLSRDMGAVSLHYTHALDYLAYAYLQMGIDGEAEAVLDNLTALQPPFQTSNRAAIVYAFSAVPARLAVERRDWERAAGLQLPTHETFGWEAGNYPADDLYPFIAPTLFARGMGLVNLGRFQEAEADIAKLRQMENDLGSWGSYWQNEIAIQRTSVQAWRSLRSGDTLSAISSMQAAVALESGSFKHPLYPNEVTHASELLGDMLRETGAFEAAISAYEISLSRSPNRLNALFGIALAAEGAGSLSLASRYFQKVLELTRSATADLPQITYARSYVEALNP
ncbi:MAG: tetratricopeptide (TPR) repeat protein [Rhodothermales bacterium]|jgi:tetratricopeptide (TPR) repeat protein